MVWGHLNIDNVADVHLSRCLGRSFNALWMKAARRSWIPENLKRLITLLQPKNEAIAEGRI